MQPAKATPDPPRGGAQVAVVYPMPRDRDAGALSVREVQILHLITLAVELDVLKRATLLSLNRHDVPVLYAGPHHLKIKAERRRDQWLYTWGRGPTRCVKDNRRAAQHLASLIAKR